MPQKSLPSIRKTITSFLLEEEGKVSKESLLKIGALVGAVSAMSRVANAAHSQNVAHSQSTSAGFTGSAIVATHSHYDPAHSSHSSHSSHASHTSHAVHSSTGGYCGIVGPT